MPRYRAVTVLKKFHVVGYTSFDLEIAGRKPCHHVKVVGNTPAISRDVWVNDCTAKTCVRHGATT